MIALHFAIDVFTLPAVVNKICLEVYFSAWIFIIGWFIIRIIDSVLATYLMPLAKKSKSRLDDTLFPFVKRFVNFVLYFIVITIILQQIGIQVTGLLAGLGIGGLAFALAAKDLLANLFGGVVVVTDKPFKIGDRIRVSGNDGKVKKISMRSTTLETFDGTNIVIPNSTIADSILENVSRERMRRVLLVLGVEYGTSTKKLEKAKKILAEIILKNNKTDDDSLVHFKAFGPSSLDIQLIYWIRDLNQILATQDEVNFAIKRAFEKEGIEFAFPSQTVYFRKD